MDLFKIATKEQMVWASEKGNLTVNDLWKLPLTSLRGVSLDSLAKAEYARIKDSEVSFVNPKKAEDIQTQIRLDILKAIIADRQEENALKDQRRGNQERAAQIKEILAQKKVDSLNSMSEEALLAELKKLDA